MHNNYFFLKKLAPQLNALILGCKFGSLFSQNKDELIIGVYSSQSQLYIKAHLSSQFSCLSFSGDFHRAKKNSVDLFPELLDQKITEVQVNSYDRSFYIKTAAYYLVFKLHGNRSNILLFDNKSCIKIFKHQLVQDKQISLNSLNKSLNLDKSRFFELNGNLSEFIPVMGKEAQQHINSQSTESPEEKWDVLQQVLREIEDDNIYVTTGSELPELLLFDSGKENYCYQDSIEAINFFFQRYIKNLHLYQEKSKQVKTINQQIKRGRSYIKKNKAKLDELQNKQRYDQIADIIMANLHQIPSNTDNVSLFDFYNNENTTIRLKPHLSPQKNAELYYRKAKNQKIEVEQLEKNIQRKEQEIKQLEGELEEIVDTVDIKSLKKKNKTKPASSPFVQSAAYQKYHYSGFDILVGKSARKNDELTFKIAHKDDLWLHAKDTKGSHVIIRRKAGHNFPKEVIEKAASLAAWYSKRKTEQYVPVSYTLRKHIRKTKDLVAGQVIVEKESVVLVPPEPVELKGNI